jgi:LysM repeat protein
MNRYRGVVAIVALAVTAGGCGGVPTDATSPGGSGARATPTVAPAGASATDTPGPSPTFTPTPAPKPTGTVKPVRTAKPAATASPRGTVYAIKAGDTLYAVAVRFKVTLAALLKANPSITNPNLIVVGQKIVIPKR